MVENIIKAEIKCNVLTASILVAQIREPPDIPQPNAEADHRQDELEFAAPLISLRSFSLRFPHPDRTSLWFDAPLMVLL